MRARQPRDRYIAFLAVARVPILPLLVALLAPAPSPSFAMTAGGAPLVPFHGSHSSLFPPRPSQILACSIPATFPRWPLQVYRRQTPPGVIVFLKTIGNMFNDQATSVTISEKLRSIEHIEERGGELLMITTTPHPALALPNHALARGTQAPTLARAGLHPPPWEGPSLSSPQPVRPQHVLLPCRCEWR